MMQRLLTTLLACVALVSATVQAKLIQHAYYSQAIEGSYIDTDPNRTISVYLPKDYDTSTQNYPVLYFLGAYNWPARFAQSLAKRFDTFVQDGHSMDFIVVMLDGDTPLRGSFYVNSKAHGNFEDFVMKEALPFVDANYRISKQPEDTAIAGFSMGGTGALRFAAKYPQHFGHVYAMSPGMFSEQGMQDSYLADEKAVAGYKLFRQQLAKAADPAAFMANAFADYQGLKLWQQGVDHSNLALVLAYGSAFAGTQSEVFGPHYTEVESSKGAWQGGFGELLRLYTNPSVLSKLQSVHVEVGNKDEYPWISEGNMRLGELSRASNSKVQVEVFEGDHSSRFGERISQRVLPHFATVFSERAEL
ncbi:hypothetical protein PRUB_b0236 [Pseudoalteromonas rubra]|uniref:Esterase n=1 Tax=Pseudoalteromonas rubra TaxID=43658 RepID=A0A8T0BZ68_9GAMM|nr:alpha/beta hydrolase-fold protein [Pseudoalteromonas rubra]KAF7781116.1 hypothetical protein PRUB_b0236 [Pseudoalteromonas rubra]